MLEEGRVDMELFSTRSSWGLFPIMAWSSPTSGFSGWLATAIPGFILFSFIVIVIVVL